jgi:hypothetical protein
MRTQYEMRNCHEVPVRRGWTRPVAQFWAFAVVSARVDVDSAESAEIRGSRRLGGPRVLTQRLQKGACDG